MLRIHRFTTTSAVAIALCAASPAAAQALISPDAIDAATPLESTIDKRSPDVRYGQPNGAPVPNVTLAPTRVRLVEVPSSGFEWGDAGIGAAGMLALVLVGVGVGMAGLHRRPRGIKATTR
jgi:hypothetical protein